MPENTLPIRPRVLRRWLWGMAAGAVLAGTGIGYAADADANPMSYLQSLNDHGLTVYDASYALRSGYTICSMLNQANGADVAAYVYTHTSWADVPDLETAATMVVVAVEELCPEHDHRASGSAFVA